MKKYIPYNKWEVNSLRVKVYYTKWGYNYFTSNDIERGIKISFTLWELTRAGIYNNFKYSMLWGNSGYWIHLLTLTRASQKKLNEIIEKAQKLTDEELINLYESRDPEKIKKTLLPN